MKIIRLLHIWLWVLCVFDIYVCEFNITIHYSKTYVLYLVWNVIKVDQSGLNPMNISNFIILYCGEIGWHIDRMAMIQFEVGSCIWECFIIITNHVTNLRSITEYSIVYSIYMFHQCCLIHGKSLSQVSIIWSRLFYDLFTV